MMYTGDGFDQHWSGLEEQKAYCVFAHKAESSGKRVNNKLLEPREIGRKLWPGCLISPLLLTIHPEASAKVKMVSTTVPRLEGN